ncbi:MAG: Hydrolase, CbbY/CbbZ/GpH/YieH family [Candidatus Gottesmanbacteria bacterium GW2011_GWB1_43_11]|uniref:Hydrolase, CbbY/CbbZ/GpH/YieH family n=1 Tax=Candidatus Gottesmanbacteria bacterium GW2011_GWB1_43_11 TaxID=1618446 RepID=A0A0G1CL76_9BACT|nr:MAG: Hydrolase, CbbY/CbbZ/GpH/YieH family [Candidatus Gottesmanbacteria bacterium GW2011_GWA2_42_16]KKS54156.1 MAG: Hydrolase, CbbY/CbbZ/GpH/YieH family [Candidatus Gottesmanbacteria bacterium GW2011_GWA1_42_26]KKS80729.1 MAG: Hydrolase, CbbY/CbbZ/GpH/YieH family [Candidatus Gottesmanbacteria bacterium GW2011_GWC1_43_10]KKS86560.1 MAG: Hydrolase, CbbY/CbbZ/GpH/YieH family [Candidatus Gottesmanbacteria bacterium GW2011_GWB1_43_11]OGG10691.1 MAG: hypothetical protein A2699_04500 [Candidatus Go
MKIKAVIFDMDGVLVDSEPVHFQANKSLFAEYSKRYSLTHVKEFTGQRIVEEYAKLQKRWSLPDSVNRLVQKRDQLFKSLIENTLELAPGALELLQFLKKKKVPVGLGTSALSWYIDFVMNRFGLREFFPVIVGSDHVKQGKPHPEVYQKTGRALGVAPESCVVLEDALTGVAAAKAAQMICFAIPGIYTKQLDYSAADKIFPDLVAVKNHLAKLI